MRFVSCQHDADYSYPPAQNGLHDHIAHTHSDRDAPTPMMGNITIYNAGNHCAVTYQ